MTAGNPAHIAEFNRTDVDEFAEAMRRQGVDPPAIQEWAIKGPDGLEKLVQRLAVVLDVSKTGQIRFAGDVHRWGRRPVHCQNVDVSLTEALTFL